MHFEQVSAGGVVAVDMGQALVVGIVAADMEHALVVGIVVAGVVGDNKVGAGYDVVEVEGVYKEVVADYKVGSYVVGCVADMDTVVVLGLQGIGMLCRNGLGNCWVFGVGVVGKRVGYGGIGIVGS